MSRAARCTLAVIFLLFAFSAGSLPAQEQVSRQQELASRLYSTGQKSGWTRTQVKPPGAENADQTPFFDFPTRFFRVFRVNPRPISLSPGSKSHPKDFPKDRQAACERAIRNALAGSPFEMAYDPSANRWAFAGIAGKLRLQRWDPYNDGPAFDVLQVHYTHQGRVSVLWAAVGVLMPPYYPIQNAESYDWYIAQNRGDQPYYVSFTEGVTSHAEAVRLFAQPGSHLVEIGVQGPHVSAQGVDWDRCEPAYSETCFLGRMFDEVFVLPGEGTATNMSDLLIFTGQGPRHPMDGYLIWNVTPTRRLDLCGAQ